jgi:DNA-binding CsgD family transcriptional regulator
LDFYYVYLILLCLILLTCSFIESFSRHDSNNFQIILIDRNISIEFLSFFFSILGFLYIINKFSFFPESTTTYDKNEDFPSLESTLDSKQHIDLFKNHYDLTNRESEILLLILKGYTNKEISEQLIVTLGTVKVHIHHIYQKVGVTSRLQLLNHVVTIPIYSPNEVGVLSTNDI